MTLDGVRKSDLVKQRILAHKQQIAYEYNSQRRLDDARELDLATRQLQILEAEEGQMIAKLRQTQRKQNEVMGLLETVVG